MKPQLVISELLILQAVLKLLLLSKATFIVPVAAPIQQQMPIYVANSQQFSLQCQQSLYFV